MFVNSHLGLDVGQANELKLAFRRSGWTNDMIKRLCEGDSLKDVLNILRGDAKVVRVNRVLDLSANPDISEEYQVVKHLKQGKVPWDRLRLACVNPRDLQYTWRSVPADARAEIRTQIIRLTCLNGKTLRPNYLKGQRPANICLRDFFIENPHLMPLHWVTGEDPILFWGTILRNKYGDFCVPGIWQRRPYMRRVSAKVDPFESYENLAVVLA